MLLLLGVLALESNKMSLNLENSYLYVDWTGLSNYFKNLISAPT